MSCISDFMKIKACSNCKKDRPIYFDNEMCLDCSHEFYKNKIICTNCDSEGPINNENICMECVIALYHLEFKVRVREDYYIDGIYYCYPKKLPNGWKYGTYIPHDI